MKHSTTMVHRLILAGVFLALCAGAQAAPIPKALTKTVQQAVAKIRPALVRIHVVFTEYEEGREIKYESMGSGVVITPEGHVLTNHHVAGHATRLRCTFADKEEIDAELVGADALTDLAVIKLTPAEPRRFPVAEFGNSSALKVGDYVLAMGSPMALSQSVTMGIVSNTALVMPRWYGPYGRVLENGEDVGSLVRWIGHDAAIYGGNSGGPLVNLKGEIVGINEIRMGLGGAIPGDLARKIAHTLIEDGAVKRAWLGILVQPLLKHAPVQEGVLISGALEGSPAAAAGVKSGDRLVRLGDKPVNIHFDEELPEFNRFVSDLPIGQPVEAVVVRDGAEQTLRITPIDREEVNPKQHELKAWGITCRDLSFVTAKEMKRADRNGVLITSVRPGGPAREAKPGLNDKDVIVRVNDTPIMKVHDLQEVTRALTEGQSELVPALVTFERKAEQFIAVVNVGIKELPDPSLEVKKAWLPAATQVISRDIAQRMERPDLTGFRVTQVYPETAAEQAGLKAGDFITAVDGEPLTASAPEHDDELRTRIRQYRVGTTVDLTILRDGQELTVPIELIRQPQLGREMKKYRNDEFDFTVRDVAFLDKAEERWDTEQRGVLVEEIKPGGWAALGGLYVGDLILEVAGRPVDNTEAIETVMGEIAGQRPAAVVFHVLRGIYTLYVELEPKWDDLP